MLITYIILILMLIVVSIVDINTRKIPNKCVFIICVLGFSCNYFIVGGLGLSHSVAGLLIGLMLMLPGYVMASMGAGDVKFMAAIGSVIGVDAVIDVTLYSYIAMLVMAVTFLCLKGDLLKMLRRVFQTLLLLVQIGHWSYCKPDPNEAASYRLPLAPAIAAGTIYFLLPKLCGFGAVVALCQFKL